MTKYKNKCITIFILIFVLTAFAPSFSADTSRQHDLRNLDWGMNKMYAKSATNAKLVDETENELYYQIKINRYKATLYLYFLSDKLSMAATWFENKYVNQNNYLSEFDVIQDALVNKYGKALYEKNVWVDKVTDNEKHNYGRAVSRGELEIISKWELPETIILHKLTGENYKIKHYIKYNSTRYKEKLDNKTKKQIKDSL